MKTCKDLCRYFLLIVLAVSLGAVGEPVEAKKYKINKKLKVMTRNVYIGTDISIFFAAQQDPSLLPLLVRQAYLDIVNADFTYRAKVIAAEIAKKGSDVVALQEVYKVYKDPSDFFTNPMGNIDFITGEITPNAQNIEFDYLELLLDALLDLGLEYEVAASQALADAEFPALLDEGLCDVRITDHDVLLVRKGGKASNPMAYLYSTAVPFEFPAPDPLSQYIDSLVIFFKRGFVAADVEHRGKTYHMVNTHLETRLEALGREAQFFQMAQALELIAAIQDWPNPVVLLGDFNSAREDPIIPLGGQNFIIPPYKLLQWNGFRDVWVSRLNRRHRVGLTCCQAAKLNNPISELYERVDLIWVKNTLYAWPFTVLGPVFATTVGDRPSPVSIVPGNAPGEEVFWPSDHAGVAAVLRIPVFK